MAGTIYSVTGPLIEGGAIFSKQALTVSWTQSRAYTDVLISAEVKGPVNEVLTAYLTTQIGPGTTAANEIAQASVAFPGSSFSNLLVLNIPLLSLGTYYLTLASTGTSGDFAETIYPTETFDTGVTRNSDYYFPNPSGYPPGNIVRLAPISGLFVFSVSGTAAVPEPSSGTLVGAALGALLITGILFRRLAHAGVNVPLPFARWLPPRHGILAAAGSVWIRKSSAI